MSNDKFYEIELLNNIILKVDKNTQEVYFADRGDSDIGKYTKRYSEAIIETWKIMESSAHKSYKPIYLDPNQKVGQSSDYLEFKTWQDLYLKDPPKGKIAPWTKKEKAYYQSLKTKRERYKYLIIRSGLKSAVIDIPYDAYCNVDENGKLINEKYAYLYEKVERNRGSTHLSDGSLFVGEWELAAGILGDENGFLRYSRLHGFKARLRQVKFLALQLGLSSMAWFKHYADRNELGLDGLHEDELRAKQIVNLAKNIPYDKFDMLPYLDEIIGVDWIMEFNKTNTTNKNNVVIDGDGDVLDELEDKVEKGFAKDPRDKDSTKESRIEFYNLSKDVLASYRDDYDFDLPNRWSERSVKRYIDSMILKARVASVTPPQGYPNAPYYYIPEYMEEIYQKGYLDKKLNPTIPAINRYDFPQYLKDEIEKYAKKHKI